MKKQQLSNVDFEVIRYANCWEDPYVLLEALAIDESSKVLSIASAGDNSFSLLSANPAKVVAVDINATQLHLCHLKKAGITHLSREEVLVLLGFEEGDRISIYNRIKKELPTESKEYFDSNTALIATGIIYQGKFEKYFELFATKIMPLIHSKKKIKALFENKSTEEQKNFYEKKWNNWRWRALFKMFFSKQVMGKLGRDPAFLAQVKINVGDFIFKQASKALSDVNCQRNFMLQFIFNQKYTTLPHYLQPEPFEIIKKNIEKIDFIKGFAEDAFHSYGSFNRFNLSNIFEYMDESTFENVGNQIISNASSSSKFAYWNLMVGRNLTSINPKVKTIDSSELKRKDNGFFYMDFVTNCYE